MENKSELLGDLAETHGGVGINYLLKKGIFKESKSKKDYLIVIKGNDIQRYHLRSWLYFDRNNPEMTKREHRIIDPPIKKIVVQRIVAHIRDHIKITATIDDKSSITFDTVTTIIPNNSGDIFYILGLLNSRLISYYFYKIIYNNAIRSMDFVPGIAKLTPILKTSEEEKNKISEIVKKLMNLNQKLLNYESEIRKIYEKYSGIKKTKFTELFQNHYFKRLKKDKKIKVRDVYVKIDEDLLILVINKKDFLKLQIKDVRKRKYVSFFLDSIYPDLLNTSDNTIFKILKDLEIDDLEDIKAIMVVTEELDDYKLKFELRNRIIELENELNNRIYRLYGLSKEEIRYIKESFK